MSILNLAAEMDRRGTIIRLGEPENITNAFLSLTKVFQYRALHAKYLDKVPSDSEAGKLHQEIIDRCNGMIMQQLAIEPKQTNPGQ